MRIPFSLIWLVVWCYVLFVSRPSEQDLFEQRLAKDQLQPWIVQIVQSVTWNSPLDKLPGALDSQMVTDYGFFTIVWEPNKKNKDYVLFGVLARFVVMKRQDMVWTRDHDVLLAMGLHVIALACFYFVPELAVRLFNVHKRRPWTIMLSTFNTQSIWSLIVTCFMLINVGQAVRDGLPEGKHPSLTFWVIYCLVPGMATLLTGTVLDRLASSLGAPGGILALTAYGTILIPNARFELLGRFRLGCFGLFLLESCQILGFNPYRHPVSLLFEIFLVACLSVFIYRVQHPFEVFDVARILKLTVITVYGK